MQQHIPKLTGSNRNQNLPRGSTAGNRLFQTERSDFQINYCQTLPVWLWTPTMSIMTIRTSSSRGVPRRETQTPFRIIYSKKINKSPNFQRYRNRNRCRSWLSLKVTQIRRRIIITTPFRRRLLKQSTTGIYN